MDIKQKIIAVTGAGRGLGRAIALSLASQGAVPRTLFRFEQLTSMMGFVAQGEAVTIAARLALPESPVDVVYRPLKPRCRRKIALAALSFDKLSPAALAFVELARKSRASLTVEH